MSIETYTCAYLITINAISFISYALDKLVAMTKSQRISERALLILALVGGFVGACMSMIIFRHKIKDITFLPYLLLISLSWIIGIIVFLSRYF